MRAFLTPVTACRALRKRRPFLCFVPSAAPKPVPTNAGAPLTPAAPHTIEQRSGRREGRRERPAARRAGQVSRSDPSWRASITGSRRPRGQNARGHQAAGPVVGCGSGRRRPPAWPRPPASPRAPSREAGPGGGPGPASHSPGASEPPRLPARLSGRPAGRRAAGREVVLAAPRRGPRVAGQRLGGSEGGGAARPACGWRPLSAVPAPGPPPPRRPPSAPVSGAGSQQQPQRPPLPSPKAPRGEARPGAGRECWGRGADAEARPWTGRPAPGSRWSRGRAAAGLPLAAPAAAARDCCFPASGCCCWPGRPRAPQVSTDKTLGPPPRPCLPLLLLFSKSCFPRPSFYSPPLPRPPFLRCFSILLGPSK